MANPKSKQSWLMGSATGVAMLAVVVGLIAAQWKHEAVPLAALVVVLILTTLSSRWLVMDVMGLRNRRPWLSSAIVAWVSFFVFAAAAKAFMTAFAL